MARGVAVLGMFTAHVGSAAEQFWSPTGWLQVADGRPAAGFALLAGVSAALLSGGPHVLRGADLRRARVRILVRAAALLPLGYLLIALGTPVVVILPGYALMFALVTVALSWSTRALLLVAGVVALVGPVVVASVNHETLPLAAVSELVVGRYYPAAVWMSYLLVGLAVGRMDLRAPGTPRRLATWGVVAAVAGYGTSAVLLPTVGPTHTLRRALLTAEPHTNTAPEVVGNVGVVLCVIALCLVGARRLAGARRLTGDRPLAGGRQIPSPLAPLAATGALALTAYCGHLVAIALLGDQVVWSPSNGRLAAFMVVTLAGTTAWHVVIGRGPLEQALHRLSTAAALAVVPRTGPVPVTPSTADAEAER